tara:strand:- start:2757 stop:3356 length:600 start_codon:yes stop_codon:yes gene_type:complete
MSDYNIYEVASWTSQTHSSMGVSAQTLTEFKLSAQNSFSCGDEDIIKLGVVINGVTRYVYGIQADQEPLVGEFRLTISFDGNVYGDLLSEGTPSTFEFYASTANDVSLRLINYNLSPSLSVATYGKEYKPYHSNLSYNISAPQQKIVYNTRFKTLYNLNEKVLVDLCQQSVYSVSPSELSAVAVNGKIKSALNFNVFIK